MVGFRGRLWERPRSRLAAAFGIVREPLARGPWAARIVGVGTRLLCVWTWVSLLPALGVIVLAGLVVVALWDVPFVGPTVVTPVAIAAGALVALGLASGLAGISIATNRIDRAWRDEGHGAQGRVMALAVVWMLPGAGFLPQYLRVLGREDLFWYHLAAALFIPPLVIGLMTLGAVFAVRE